LAAPQVRAQSAAATAAAPSGPVTDPERLARLRTAFPAIDSLMRAFAERSHVPGIAYGIVVDGRLAHAGLAGYRELAARAPVDTATVFRIASMTKSFTAAAILQLRDAGRLSLDDPAERFVPELAGLRYPTSDAPKITIRHLLSHSAGFPEDNPWGDRQLGVTEKQMSRMMRAGIPFSTAPGTAYEYSNYGFAILGRIVANASGQPYRRYLAEHVLRPLGMRATTLEPSAVPPERRAHGYRRQDDTWLEEPQLPDGAFGPMGGMLSSVGDLARWVGFMLDAWPARDGEDRGPLRRASRREMQQVARYRDGSAVRADSTGAMMLNAGGYGYGLRIQQTCRFRTLVSHSGGLPGFGSIMRWLPEYGVGVVALGNLTYTSWGDVSQQALELLADTAELAPRAPKPAPVLLQRQAQVSRLIGAWDHALADSIAAMNLYLDESKERRRKAIEELRRQAGGECGSSGPLEAENALRGRWRLRCRDHDLAVSITLAPTAPAGVQFLEVRQVGRDERLATSPTCR
jgi:CubicO group peptidase (beta-lactamase class C family)